MAQDKGQGFRTCGRKGGREIGGGGKEGDGRGPFCQTSLRYVCEDGHVDRVLGSGVIDAGEGWIK